LLPRYHHASRVTHKQETSGSIAPTAPYNHEISARGVRMGRHLHLALLAVTQLVLAPGAWAQGNPIIQACRPDIPQVCYGVPFGGGRVIRCLRDHAAQVSPNCAQALAAAPAPIGAPPPGPPGAVSAPEIGAPPASGAVGAGFRQACQQELQLYCRESAPGGGRLIRCLREHNTQLSIGCAQTLLAVRAGPPAGATAPPGTSAPVPPMSPVGGAALPGGAAPPPPQ
jgi:hypothetical protein